MPRVRSLSLLALALLPTALACGDGGAAAPGDDATPTPRFTYDWHVETAAELGEKIGCVVFGDFDPDTPGDEIAALGGSGRVWILTANADAWASQLVAQAPGEMIQGVAADLDPTVEGDELVLVGMAAGDEEGGGPGAAPGGGLPIPAGLLSITKKWTGPRTKS